MKRAICIFLLIAAFGLTGCEDSKNPSDIEAPMTPPANSKTLKLDTTNFDTNLSSADDTLQKAMETLDETTSSPGLLSTLTVDNITINGNTINADSGDLNLTPAAGSDIILDGTINVDGGAITNVTSIITGSFFTDSIDGVGVVDLDIGSAELTDIRTRGMPLVMVITTWLKHLTH